MHIKRLLSGSLAAMMVATSFNVPINAKAAEVPDTEPAAGLEENQELPSSDAEIPVDDDTNVVVEEPAEEPEVVTPEAEALEVEETEEETVVGDDGEGSTTEPEETETAVVLTADMIKVPTDLVYTGEVLNPTITVDPDGDGPKTATVGTDYTLTFSPEEVKNAGTYKVTVTPNENSTVLKGDAVEKEFTVAKYELKAENITLAKEEGEGAAAGQYHITYSYEGTTESVNKPTPAVTVKGFGEDALSGETDYEVEYSGNDQVGDAKVTVSVKGTVANYKTPEGGIEMPFKVVEDDTVDEAKTTIDKAGFNYPGSINKVLNSGRKTSETIPAIARWTIPTAIKKTEEGFDKTGFENAIKLYYSDNSLASKDSSESPTISWEIEWKNVAEGATTIGYTLKLSGTNYGKYGDERDNDRAASVTEISGEAKIVDTTDKTYEATDYDKLVVDSPATFKAVGTFHYENELGEAATKKTGDILTPAAESGEGALTHEIKKLEATLEQEDESEANKNKYVFTGEEITPAVTVTTSEIKVDKDGKRSLEDVSLVYKDYDENSPIIVNYEDYINPGTAKATITVKDRAGLYSDSTVIPYEIITKDEVIQQPYPVDYYIDKHYSYGTKVRFKTLTEGADIHYTVSSNGESVQESPTIDSTKYTGPITLESNMAKNNKITFWLIAIKKDGEKTLESPLSIVEYTMINPDDDWGEITESLDRDQWGSSANVPEGLWVGNSSITVYPKIYNGKPQTYSNLRVYYHKKLLNNGTDYTVKYANNTNAWVKNDSQYAASKQPSFTVTGKGKYSGTFTKKFEIKPISLSEVVYDGTQHKYTSGNVYLSCTLEYLASAQKPVKASGVKLYEADTTDGTLEFGKVIAPSNYTLTYYDESNPSEFTRNPGTKVVCATMKGNYTGVITQTYEVLDPYKALSKNTNISIKTSIKWEEGGVNPQLVITDKATKARLIQGEDYTVSVSYYGNGTYGDVVTNQEYRNKFYDDETLIKLTSVGTYYLYIHGYNNYTGGITKIVNVTGTKLSIKDFKVDSNKYTGNPIVPSYKVMSGKNEVNNTDTVNYYFAALGNNTYPGTAKLTVEGNNDYGFVATPVTKTFKIVGTPLTTKNVTISNNAIPYDDDWGLDDFGLTVKDGATTLGLGTDYTAVLYDSYASATKYVANTNSAGKKVLVVTGKEEKGYTGTVKLNVKFTPIDLAKDTGRIKAEDVTVSDAMLSKLGATPYVAIKDSGIGVSGTNLVLNKDYTVKVSNNTVVADKNAKKAPTVTITGKGNYTGKLTKTFDITAGDLSFADITAVDQTAGKFVPAKTKVVVTLGKALTAGEKKDYTVKYYFNAGTQGVKYTEDKEEKTAYGNAVEVKPNYVLEPGTEINVVATGTGTNYTGNISTTIRVAKAGFDISKASFAIANQTYTGSEILVGSENFTKSTLGKTALEYGTDYIIDEDSYVANTNVGTAKVTVKGIGNYAGSKVVSFKIKAKSMLYNLAFEAPSQNTGTTETLNPTGTTKTLTSKDGTFKLPAPTFKGVDSKKYVFEGWYTDPELHNFVGIKGDTCSFSDKINAGETYTLYAKYEKVGSYVITFDKNKPNTAPTGFDVTGTMKNQTIKRGALTALTNNAYKLNGYTFKGWSYTSNGAVVYNNKQKVYNAFSAGETPNKLYAVWEPIEYKVTFKDGGSYNYSTLSYSTDEGLNINIPTKAGYEFISWKVSNSKVELREVKDENDENVVGYEIPVGTTGNLTLTGTWKAKDFKVRFDNNAAVFNGALGTVTGTMPELQFKSDVVQKLPANAFKVTGDYTFAGWSNHAAINNHVVTKDKASVKLASSVDITMYAVWRENTYAIKYSGATVTTAAPRSYTLAAGSATVAQALSATTPDVRKGYTFSGWSTDGKTVIASTNTEEIAKLVKTKLPITLKAVWTKETAPVANTITYKFEKSAATGAESGDKKPADIVLKAGENATYPNNPWTWEGHTFKGWISTADHAAGGQVAEDKIHAEGSPLTAPATIESSTDTTMYAYWVADTPSETKYTITFAPGTYGNDAIPTGTMAPVEADAGEYTLPESGYTASGYNFAGWKIGNSDDVKKAGDKITINGNVTITATWTPDTPSITYYLDGGRWAESYSAPATYTVGNTAATTLPVEANISKDEAEGNTYAFAGWVVVSAESDDVSSGTTITKIPEDSTSALKLKAKWTATPVTPDGP